MARLEVIRLAGGILKDEATHIAEGGDWRVEVTDDAGLTLLRVMLSMIEAPVLLRPAAPR